MQRLPVLAVIRGAFTLPAQHAGELFRAAGLPLLAFIATTLAWEFLPMNLGWLAAWVAHLFQLFVFSWLATTVHRLVLLDEASSRVHFATRAWQRVGVYFLALVFLSVVYLAIKFILFNGIGLASGISYVAVGEDPNLLAQRWIDWFTTLVALLVVARLVLVLPSIAVERGNDFRKFWRLSRRNSWRLAVVYGALPWGLSWLNWLLFRDGGSSLELAIMLVIGCLLAVVTITALSLSYSALTAPAAPEPPPTDPRG